MTCRFENRRHILQHRKGAVKVPNQNAEIIDELNKRIEEAEDNEEIEATETLKSFYEWFVERYIY